ncbi:MAG: nitrilase-related carbon-nitrogen hydrolase [Bacteroidota bacterium]
MASRPRAQHRPFSSFGWSLTGALLIALSLPPLGFYPLAWVGLVPLLVRWSIRTPSLSYVRELYALLLTTSCCVGFWVLFNPDASQAAQSGLSLFLVPLPLVVAFTLSGLVKDRHGIRLGLLALITNVVAAEYLLLRSELSIPWLLLGHTQVGAVEFIQMADIGGVTLLSAWVLLLNAAAFLVLPQSTKPGERYGERGISVAFFTVLIALPVAYGAVRTAQADVPDGYARVGIVQPGLLPTEWAERSTSDKVDYLASLSNNLLQRWTTLDSTASVAPAEGVGLILWPQASIASVPENQGTQGLYAQIQRWTEQRGVSLLAGATTTEPSSQPFMSPDSRESALLFRPDRSRMRYVQGTSGSRGAAQMALHDGDIQIGTAFGSESLRGDRLRQTTADGADLIVALSHDSRWGRSAGLYQNLHFTRLRAIESRRAVVMATVGGVSALIRPSGAIEEIAGLMEQGSTTVDVPTHEAETFYVRYGDWLGLGALLFGLVFHAVLYLLSAFVPEVFHKKVPGPRRRPAFR